MKEDAHVQSTNFKRPFIIFSLLCILLGILILKITQIYTVSSNGVQEYSLKLKPYKPDKYELTTDYSLHTEFEEMIPFYVYKSPHLNWYQACSEHFSNNSKNSEFLQYKHSTSIHFLQSLHNHPWRVIDPEKAKLFVLPFLLGLLRLKKTCNRKSLSRFKKSAVLALKTDPVAKKYWNRNNGIDHVMVDTDFRIEKHDDSLKALAERRTYNLAKALRIKFKKSGRKGVFSGSDKSLLDFSAYFENMTIGHHVRQPIMDLTFGAWKYFKNNRNKWGCTVLVPMFERLIHKDTKLTVESFLKRPIDLFFMGQWDSKKGYAVRRFLNDEFSKPGWDHINYIYATHIYDENDESLPFCDFNLCLKSLKCQLHCKITTEQKFNTNLYSKLIGMSKFALEMSGDNAGSTRYFDAPNSGSIPIFLTDLAFTDGLPFVGKVAWRDFSYFLPVGPLEKNDDTEQKVNLLREIKEIVELGRKQDQSVIKKFKSLIYYRDQLSWSRNATLVSKNFFDEAWHRCVKPFL